MKLGSRGYNRRMHSESLAEPADSSPPEAADSLVLWMLSLSPAERLEVLQGFVDSAAELGRAGRTTV